MCHTLLGVQQQLLLKEKSLSEIVRDELENLIEKGLLKGKIMEKDQNSKSTLTITLLGKATYKGKINLILQQALSSQPYLHLMWLAFFSSKRQLKKKILPSASLVTK